MIENLPLRPRKGWRNEAACDGENPEDFYRPRVSNRIKALCAGCPVRLDCLRDALDWEIAIFGGLNSMRRPVGFVGGVSAPERWRYIKELVHSSEAAA